jgi:signal transduction histidine kinase
MSLSRRIMVVIILALISALMVAYITSELILRGGFEQLEKDETIINVERARNALNDDIHALLFVALDWSKWDDTFHFVGGDDPSYIEANLLDETFASLNLNLMVFLDTSNRIVYEKGFDLENRRALPAIDSFTPYLDSGSPLLKHPDATSEIAGVVMLPQGPMLVVSLPILHSNNTGPIGGTMIWGQFLEQSAIENMSQVTSLDLSIVGYDTADLPIDFQAAKADLSAQNAVFTRPLDEETIAGYTLIDDVAGQPSLILKMQTPRHIYAQGQASIFYFLVAQVIIGVGFTFVIAWVLQRRVLSPLSRLSQRVMQIQKMDDLSLPVKIDGSDELATLSADIACMLKALSQSRARLQQAHDQQEKQVEARTRDLSEANALLAQARDQALEGLRLKTQIVANISHDSRTPLTTIGLYTDLLLTDRYGVITPEQRKIIDNIKVNSRQLLSLINNLLAEAQMSSGKMKLLNVDFKPQQFLDEVKSLMSPLAEQKSLCLITQIAPDFPTSLHGDPDRLKQILTNLIDNAVKFTRQGEVRTRFFKPDPQHWAVEVSDTGGGISPELHQRIFEPFWQVDGSPTRAAGRGVGLGLSIVKNLAANMNAEVAVLSDVGVGSTFRIIFPVEE